MGIVEGYKRPIDKIRGPIAKMDFWAKIWPGGRKTARRATERPLKIDPKVPNRRYRRGLQTGHRRNPGCNSKKRIFGPKSGPVAGKRPTERPNGHLLGAWGQFFSEYRQVGYPERRNDMP